MSKQLGLWLVVMKSDWGRFEEALDEEITKWREIGMKWFEYHQNHEHNKAEEFMEKESGKAGRGKPAKERFFKCPIFVPSGAFDNFEKVLDGIIKVQRRVSMEWYRRYKETGEAEDYKDVNIPDLFVCLDCGEVFSSKEELKEHKEGSADA